MKKNRVKNGSENFLSTLFRNKDFISQESPGFNGKVEIGFFHNQVNNYAHFLKIYRF